MKGLLKPTELPGAASIGLLLARVAMGVAFVIHGRPKIENPTGWGTALGYSSTEQVLAAIAEYGGGIALLLGAGTRIAALGLAVTMAFAIEFHVRSGHRFIGEGQHWELAGIYLALSLLFLLVGPGAASIDQFLFAKDKSD